MSNSDLRISIDPAFESFINEEVLPGLPIGAEAFWSGLEAIIAELTPENRRLLAVRDELQQQIDQAHQAQDASGPANTLSRQFLQDIGYIVPAGEPFAIRTENVDAEIAAVAGPQLVVPVSNARFALNAANARWGSLYDALYGTDVIPADDGKAAGSGYNPARGEAVIRKAAEFLNTAVPLSSGSHVGATAYEVINGPAGARLEVVLADGTRSGLASPGQFIAHSGEQAGDKQKLLLVNNGLHIEICIDRSHPVGQQSAAGVYDIEMESALTTIQDCEDSVAAVDSSDKIGVYRNWLGLMQGTLEANFSKGGKQLTRRMNADREYVRPDGSKLSLPGRSLLLVRNVGHLMTTDAVHDADGKEVFEGILDAVVTVACAMHDVLGQGPLRNSRTGSIYIVKPKMHGPEEVAFANTLFSRVEDLFGLQRHTIKIGVMDEERRTTVNLAECIRAVQDRLVFINTGFLDRTGDEIHTSMLAGPVLPKEQIKAAPWIAAYEDWNVDIGIRCGLPGRAQIGKGMWPKPDEMKEMLNTKAAHPKAGANCAWVPSPTAATLHAMHYHQVNVAERQRELASRPLASLDDILTPPLCDGNQLDAETVQADLDNNAQGILGYVVRWIDQGVGCSKVPDINDVGLMEDRATLRISSQHMANWLQHGICTLEQVKSTFQRMAKVVDEQNAGDPAYIAMAPDFDNSTAYQAALDLVLKGTEQPSGYTEPLLHAYRRKLKAQAAG